MIIKEIIVPPVPTIEAILKLAHKKEYRHLQPVLDLGFGLAMRSSEISRISWEDMGAFFWSHDIGGHTNGRNEESYTRWRQFGAFSAVLRSHSTRDASTDRRPWTYHDWAEASMRRSFRLRSEMMPYLYTSIWQGTKNSIPFIRPLYIDNPDLEEAYHNSQEYEFVDNLLVAPITQPGVGPNRVATQAVWFPEGEWYDFFTGERFTGPTEGIAADSIDTFPLYARGGVHFPMQAYTARPGTAPLTDLVLRCYPSDDGKRGVSTVHAPTANRTIDGMKLNGIC